MNNDDITALLRNYRSYEYAVRNGESEPASLGFGPRIQAHLNSSRMMTVNQWDYSRYTRIVTLVKGAVEEVLDDDEQRIIRHKYMDRNVLTLSQIADRCHMAERRAKYLHKKALGKLGKALMFVDIPEIHNVDYMLTS